jgi:hypothetical protein
MLAINQHRDSLSSWRDSEIHSNVWYNSTILYRQPEEILYMSG